MLVLVIYRIVAQAHLVTSFTAASVKILERQLRVIVFEHCKIGIRRRVSGCRVSRWQIGSRCRWIILQLLF